MDGKQKLTLQELQALAQADGRGLQCRQCGCRDFRVYTTRKGNGVIVRYRICRHCGLARTTIES